VIAFNAGDGPVLGDPSVGTDDTASLGGASLSYANLNSRSAGNNLILNVKRDRQITSPTGTRLRRTRSAEPPVVAEAMAGFNPTGGNPLLDNR